ncbi:MAG: hypothetical protein HY727_06550 [Candidatus Rokubacteria bacterium]|nr:hypothetical protein [Candidatus Rokubacteria bacterium]
MDQDGIENAELYYLGTLKGAVTDNWYPIRGQHALTGPIGFSWDAQGAPWGLVALGREFSRPKL